MKVWIVTIPILLILLFIFRNQSQIMFSIFTIAILLYLLTALLHHLKDRTFHFEIVIEYFLIAAFALIVLYGLLL